VSDELRVAGSANTFEATVNLELIDAHGDVLAEDFVTATSGSGTRGTFDHVLPIPEGATGPATLVAFEMSARDGSRSNMVRVPVTIRAS
jgi:germination protein M